MSDEIISDDDLQIMREAIAQLSQAAATKAFVEGFVARKYGLQNGDSVDIADGTISRTTTEPVKETAE